MPRTINTHSVASGVHASSRASLVEDVYNRLKQEILSLELAPGTALIETSVANSLGISRTPLREALRRLHQEGLVDIDHGRGARVSGVSFRDAIEAYDIRILVEPNAARLAARLMTPELAARLKHMRDAVAQPSLTSNPAERWQIDRELHNIILQAAGNEMLRSFLWDLRVRTERAFTYYGAQRDLHSTQKEHIKLVDAILTSDEEQAEHLMRQHLLNVRARLTQP
jgi:DNA-binding GntR family transcriptional regulator